MNHYQVFNRQLSLKQLKARPQVPTKARPTLVLFFTRLRRLLTRKPPTQCLTPGHSEIVLLGLWQMRGDFNSCREGEKGGPSVCSGAGRKRREGGILDQFQEKNTQVQVENLVIPLRLSLSAVTFEDHSSTLYFAAVPAFCGVVLSSSQSLAEVFSLDQSPAFWPVVSFLQHD